MTFNSFSYFIFLAFVFLIQLTLPKKYRWLWLLAASLWFYASFIASYVWVMVGLSFVDWVAGIWLEKKPDIEQPKIWGIDHEKFRKFILSAAISLQLFQLILFKYLGFFTANINGLMASFGAKTNITEIYWLLPLGISFHTFQSISYMVDIYRGDEKPEKNPLRVLFFLIFFPQLVAGPIERASHLLSQIRAGAYISSDRIHAGIFLIFYGLFKKLVIADQAATFVNVVYADIKAFEGLALLLAQYLFWIQMYFDFSGYIAIAQGTALILGYELMENFNQPYLSRSIADFWQRWHISLSTWFRDYLYQPILMSREHLTSFRLYLATLIVFFLSGLWHGASWNFVIFGVIHGVCIVCSQIFKPFWNKVWKKLNVGKKSKLLAVIQIFTSFHLVLLSWVYFRSQTLVEAGKVFAGMIKWKSIPWEKLPASMPSQLIALALSLVVIYFWREARTRQLFKNWSQAHPYYTWMARALLLYYFILVARFETKEFIYFKF